MTSRRYDPSWRESWKTPEVRDAEAGLEAVARQADKTLADLEKLRLAPPPLPSDADIRKVEEAARAPNAPRELRELQRRVDDGELSWRDIVEGKHMDDPGVREAAQANLAKLRRVYQKLEEGYSLNEVLDSERPAGQAGRRWTS